MQETMNGIALKASLAFGQLLINTRGETRQVRAAAAGEAMDFGSVLRQTGSCPRVEWVGT